MCHEVHIEQFIDEMGWLIDWIEAPGALSLRRDFTVHVLHARAPRVRALWRLQIIWQNALHRTSYKFWWGAMLAVSGLGECKRTFGGDCNQLEAPRRLPRSGETNRLQIPTKLHMARHRRLDLRLHVPQPPISSTI